jgi:hypothetical protein
MLGVAVVDGDDREGQYPIGSHGAQTNHTRGGFFGAADHLGDKVATVFEDTRYQVGTVVLGNVGVVSQSSFEVLVVGLVVFALDGIDGDFFVATNVAAMSS